MATPQDNNNNGLFLSFAALKTLLIVEVKQRCPESTFGWGAGIFFCEKSPGRGG
jgi:hypothetical protein